MKITIRCLLYVAMAYQNTKKKRVSAACEGSTIRRRRTFELEISEQHTVAGLRAMIEGRLTSMARNKSMNSS